MNNNLHEFYEQLKQEGILFCFSGPVSQSILEGMGETLRQKMDLEETNLTTSQKIFSIFVEQMQNIINYSADRNALADGQGDLGLGVVIVGKNETGHYYLLAGNKFLKKDEVQLRTHLEIIQRMDKDELKLLYKERRRGGALEGSKGAGLGLIEMARKSSLPIQFQFSSIDEQHAFFSIKVTI